MEVIRTYKYGHTLKPLKFIGRNLSHRKKVELKKINKYFIIYEAIFYSH